MKTFDVIPIGSITLDIFVPIDDDGTCTIEQNADLDKHISIPLGAKIQTPGAQLLCGGGAANTAVGFEKLGLKTAPIGVVGDDASGRFLKGELEAQGVNVEYTIPADLGISSYSVILNSWVGERTVFTNRARAVGFDERILHNLPACRAVYIGHLAASGDRILHHLAAYKARHADLTIAWNPGSTQFKAGVDAYRELLAVTDYLILNVEEAEAFLGMKAEKRPVEDDVFGARITGYEGLYRDRLSDLRPLGAAFLEMGVREIVITDGVRGSQLFSKDHHLFAPCKIAKLVDSLGAGDAFSVGYVGAALHDKTHAERMLWGAYNAASVIEHQGAQAGLLDINTFRGR